METNYTQEYIDELIAKRLAGEATAHELNVLTEWKSMSENNATYLAQFEKLWDLSADTSLFENKTQGAWMQVQNQIQNKPAPRLQISFRAALAIAASVAIIAVVWFSMPGKNTNPNIENTTAKALHIEAGNKEITATLPDNTLVILQPHAVLEADTNFGKTHRLVQLNGDAYFRTVHGKKHVFTVKTAQMVVEDIGTAFYVQMRNNRPLVWVSEGSVKVKSHSDSQLLVKNDSVIVNSENHTLQIINTKNTQTENKKETKDKKLIFEKTALSKVVETLNYSYQADIRLGSDKIANCLFAAKFENEKLETILDVLRETLNLEIRRDGNIIYLEGKGCQ